METLITGVMLYDGTGSPGRLADVALSGDVISAVAPPGTCDRTRFGMVIDGAGLCLSPGWIDTNYVVYEGADAIQQPSGRVGNPLDIANMVIYLCSDMSGFITGENICIDGGMTKQMIYHGDHGWSLDETK